jgi:hypothetical protein
MLLHKLNDTQKIQIRAAEVGKGFPHSSVIRLKERNKENAPNPTKRLTTMQYIELMQVSIFSNCGIEEECSHLPEQPLYHGPHTQIQCGTCGQINITRFHIWAQISQVPTT